MKRIYIGILLISLTTLMMELVLIRVFDVILTPNIGYMVITCTMFSFGLSGIYVTLRPLSSQNDVRKYLSILALVFSISILVILPIMNFLPFDYSQIPDAPLLQAVSFGGMYLTLVIPFFLSGLIIVTLFSAYANKIQFLYFWDLVGAAMGCVIIIPFISVIGPGGLLFCASAVGLFASAFFSKHKLWSLTSITIGVLILFIPIAHLPDYYDFREHLSKRGIKESRIKGTIEFSRWDPISKIDVVDRVDEERSKHVAYDGGAQQTNIYPFDGDYLNIRENLGHLSRYHFWQPGVLVSHYLKRDSGQKVLIIGSAGGQETKAAIMYGASHVDAVELVGTVVELGKDKYAEYNGNIFNHPNVHVRVGEGRSFLRASSNRYDIIQIFSNHTSSSIAAGTGAMATSYLQTAEAYQEYFEHLTNDGILHINHHIYTRMVTTAALAWKRMGYTDFQKHVIVLEAEGGRDSLPTFLVKMTPWNEMELNELKNFHHYKNLVVNPLHPENSFLTSAFFSGDFPTELVKKISYRITPTTDNKPYFNFLRKKIGLIAPDPEHFLNISTSAYLNSQMNRFIPMDIVHLFVTGTVSLFFAGVFIFLPIYFCKVGKSKWTGKKCTLLYFSCLGAGFIIIELTFIHIFMKLIGFPLYSFATVIFSLLLAAGTGSLFSKKLNITLENRWYWPFIGVLITGYIILQVHPYIFDVFLASPTMVRIFVSSLLIFPLGFFLGMPFPLGILAIEKQPGGAIAWAWGMNGLFTVIGGLLSIVLSIYLGFKLTLLIALAIYALAFLSFCIIRKEGGYSMFE